VPAPSDSIARVAASQFIISPEDAGRRYSEIAGWEQIVSDPRVDSAVYEVIPGSIIPAHQDMRSRIAEIQFHGDNAEEVEAFRQTIVETARIVRA
jgi:methionine salvage enolase-phosphatase E1